MTMDENTEQPAGNAQEYAVEADNRVEQKIRSKRGWQPWRHWWFWLLLFAALATCFYVFVIRPGTAQHPLSRQAQNAARTMPVMGAVAKTGDVSIYLNGLGSVTAQNTVTVKPRVDGQLMKVLFTEGQVVKQGELLAEIDARPYQVMLTQAEGQIAKDQALLKNAQLDVERYRTLFQQDSIAQQQLATQQALVQQYQGAVKADQGQVDSAKLQLIYTRVVAPIGGRLGLRQVDPGNVVHASDTTGLVVITQLQPITVVFTMPEDSLPRVMQKLQAKQTLAVDIYDRAQKNKLASGTLLTVDNQIDPTTGTVKLKAQFSNQNYALFPNQFVNTQMLVDVLHDATLIPSAGVQRGSHGTFVYVVRTDNGSSSVSLRPVTLGPSEGTNVAIKSGLKPGEVVVVDGADKLREGAKVILTLQGAKPSAAPAPSTTRPANHGRRPHPGAA